MLRNKRLARHVADAGFGEIRRQLTYKGQRNACPTIVADRWYPSSKTCSNCGAVKAKLPLHVRVFTCDACGLVLDRDENAGHNLVALVAACTTGTGVAGDQDTPGVSKPRGADRKTRRQRPDRNTGRGGRAGGASPPHPRRKETGTVVRTPSATHAPVTPSWTFQTETSGMLRVTETLSNGTPRPAGTSAGSASAPCRG
ncbi:RNA-guided endonuclease InsQ/TnpB family protein [Streptomyces milbemycinicus]|uniref:RNA-guided endonuclease InsQ/TnpB family protein n=1 Tax=Streptomyces milbemycinicus TaxID=476552 RepID=UPI0033D04BF2